MIDYKIEERFLEREKIDITFLMADGSIEWLSRTRKEIKDEA